MKNTAWESTDGWRPPIVYLWEDYSDRGANTGDPETINSIVHGLRELASIPWSGPIWTDSGTRNRRPIPPDHEQLTYIPIHPGAPTFHLANF